MTAGLEEGFRKVIRPAVVAVETVIKSGGARAVIGQSKGRGQPNKKEERKIKISTATAAVKATMRCCSK